MDSPVDSFSKINMKYGAARVPGLEFILQVQGFKYVGCIIYREMGGIGVKGYIRSRGYNIGVVDLIVFGEPNIEHSGSAATKSTVIDCVSPVYIGPGSSLVVHPWSASAATTAAEFHVEVGWDELGYRG